MSAHTRALLMLLAVSAIWGFASPVIKITFPYFPPALFLTYRFAITILLLIPLTLYLEPKTLHQLKELSPNEAFLLFLSGFLGSTVQLGLLFWGLDLTTTLDGSVINATSPVFVAIAGIYFLKEKVTSRELLGLIVSFIGTLVIVIQPLLEGQKLFSGSVLGNFLVLAGTVSWVGYVVITKKQLKHKITPLVLTTNMFVVGFITMSIILFYLNTPSQITTYFQNASLTAHACVVYMAYISGALAYFLYQKAQKLIEVSEANIVLYLAPVFTIPLSYFWLGERITLPFAIGSLIIVAGVVLSEFRTARSHHVS